MCVLKLESTSTYSVPADREGPQGAFCTCQSICRTLQGATVHVYKLPDK